MKTQKNLIQAMHENVNINTNHTSEIRFKTLSSREKQKAISDILCLKGHDKREKFGFWEMVFTTSSNHEMIDNLENSL